MSAGQSVHMVGEGALCYYCTMRGRKKRNAKKTEKIRKTKKTGVVCLLARVSTWSSWGRAPWYYDDERGVKKRRILRASITQYSTFDIIFGCYANICYTYRYIRLLVLYTSKRTREKSEREIKTANKHPTDIKQTLCKTRRFQNLIYRDLAAFRLIFVINYTFSP